MTSWKFHDNRDNRLCPSYLLNQNSGEILICFHLAAKPLGCSFSDVHVPCHLLQFSSRSNCGAGNAMHRSAWRLGHCCKTMPLLAIVKCVVQLIHGFIIFCPVELCVQICCCKAGKLEVSALELKSKILKNIEKWKLFNVNIHIDIKWFRRFKASREHYQATCSITCVQHFQTSGAEVPMHINVQYVGKDAVVNA